MSANCPVARSASILIPASACLIATVLLGTSACADVVYETSPPGGFLGYWGPDVFDGQSVAIRFTPAADFTLDRARVWFMNNDGDGGHPPVTLSLRTDDAKNNIPSGTILEQWQFNVSTVGWDPMLEQLDSVLHPALDAGVNYWLVAQSTVPAGLNGVWVMAAESSGIMSICNGIPCEWSPAGKSAIAGTLIEGTPVQPCPADVTGDDGAVNIDDLLLVINNWGQGAGNPADVTGNDIVDIDDLLDVINGWGNCP